MGEWDFGAWIGLLALPVIAIPFWLPLYDAWIENKEREEKAAKYRQYAPTRGGSVRRPITDFERTKSELDAVFRNAEAQLREWERGLQ